MHVYRLAIALFVASTNAYHAAAQEDNFPVAPDIDIAAIQPDPASEAAIRGWNTKSSSSSPDDPDRRDDGTEDAIRGWNSQPEEPDLQDMRRLVVTSSPSTGDPLESPTSAPTPSPTTAGPTPSPTSRPSRAPVTFSPVTTTEAAAIAEFEDILTPATGTSSDDVVTIEVTVPSAVSFNGIPCDADQAVLRAAAARALLKKQCGKADGTLRTGCSIDITRAALCPPATRGLRFFRGRGLSRKLSTGGLEIDFTTKIVAYCQTATCTDRDEVLVAVAAVVEQTITEATTTSTTSTAAISPLLVSIIDEVAVVVQEKTDEAIAAVEAGTATDEQKEVAETAEAIAAAETGATLTDAQKLLVDAAAAASTGINNLVEALNIATTDEAVVKAAVAPAVATLLAAAATLAAADDWYPNWAGSDHTCKNDGNAPFYMVYNGNWIKSSLTDCCTHYYSWDYNACIKGGGGDLSELEDANAWYVFWEDNECKQSCDEKSTKTGTDKVNCGGIAATWDKTYSDPKSCCENHLWWIPESSCIADSTKTTASGTTAVGSGKWYIDHNINKCVRDCEKTSSDKNCGGLAESWEKNNMSSSSSQCCSTHLWYKERKDCTLA